MEITNFSYLIPCCTFCKIHSTHDHNYIYNGGLPKKPITKKGTIGDWRHIFVLCCVCPANNHILSYNHLIFCNYFLGIPGICVKQATLTDIHYLQFILLKTTFQIIFKLQQFSLSDHNSGKVVPILFVCL
jgi:hypothetical protein